MMINEYWVFTKGIARCEMSKSPEKLLTDILMGSHSLEKAFSMPNKRKVFGVNKFSRLVSNIQKFISKYGFSDQLIMPISVALQYVAREGSNVKDDQSFIYAEKKLNSILAEHKHPYNLGGSNEVASAEELKYKNADFEQLAKHRHSYRHFSDKPIDKKTLIDCLQIAKYAPSACNRQGYKVHVFSGKLKDKFLSLQGGSKGFYNEANIGILITGNLNRYYTREVHLPYVDASLFAMSLIYALTSKGIASIPLTLGIDYRKLSKMKKQLSIPDNEVPVIAIAIGNYPEKADISLSYRRDYDTFTTFHE